MKTKHFYQLSTRAIVALLVTVTIAAGFTACSVDDNAIINPPSKQIIGNWYAEQNQPGSFDADGVAVSYQKIVQYASFRDNGDGFWSIIFVDEGGHAIDIPGYFCGGGFTYTEKSGNTIGIMLKSAGIPILKDSWDVTFANGRLYVATPEISHTMAPITDKQNASVKKWLRELGLGASPVVDLTELEADYVVQDGDVLTGTLSSDKKITIADGATVTLDGVTINRGGAGIICEGSATIVLADDSKNTLTSKSGGSPALMVGPDGSTLTIDGNTGELNVRSHGSCSGIGGGYHSYFGAISIKGGVITAQGGFGSPGIGADVNAWCGDINIIGGTIKAIGGEQAPGIGAGLDATCGDINIRMGVHSVVATRGRETDEHIPIGRGRGNSHCGHVRFGRQEVGYNTSDWEKKLKDGTRYGCLMLTFSSYDADSYAFTWTLKEEFNEGDYYPLDSPNRAPAGEDCEKMFDGKEDTKWCCSKESNKWSVEFMSKQPITPIKYTLTTGNDTKNFAGRNPKKWELYGKLHDTDRWTLLDSQDDGALPADNIQKKSFSCREKECQFFRFVISESAGDDLIQLSEFKFDIM